VNAVPREIFGAVIGAHLDRAVVRREQLDFPRAREEGDAGPHRRDAGGPPVPRDHGPVQRHPPRAFRQGEHRDPRRHQDAAGDAAHIRQTVVIELAIEDDEIRQRRRGEDAAGDLARGVRPVPFDIFPGEARQQALLVVAFAAPLVRDDRRFAKSAIEISGDQRRRRHVETVEMPFERARQIERGLQAGFLSGVVMHQQQNVLHEKPPTVLARVYSPLRHIDIRDVTNGWLSPRPARPPVRDRGGSNCRRERDRAGRSSHVVG